MGLQYDRTKRETRTSASPWGGEEEAERGLKTVGWLSNVSLACDVDLCTIVMGLLRRPSERPVVVAFPVTCRTTNQTAASRPLYGSVAAGLTIETRALYINQNNQRVCGGAKQAEAITNSREPYPACV
jgi:hypothetical protein